MAPKSKKSSSFEYPLVLAELQSYGFVVMPLEVKRPIIKRWNKLQKTPDRFVLFENRNIGILTGAVSGITVLDIDTKDNGMKIWKCISSVYPEISTPMVKTPNGGLHIYFRYNKNLRSFSKIKVRSASVGWDLLNNDRQAVAPPSIIGTSRYKWVKSPKDIPFASMPKWLEDYLNNGKALSAKGFK